MIAAAPDTERIRRLSFAVRRAVDSGQISGKPFDFVQGTGRYPAPGSEGALDYFFGVVLHQFGFWTIEGGTWAGPMYAEIGGKRLKGSDFVWTAATAALERDSGQFRPERCAETGDEEFDSIFADDSGASPLPMKEEHRTLHRAYGRGMLLLGMSPEELVAEANRSKRPIARFLDLMGGIPGYAEDPLRKKLVLLSFTITARPEGWLLGPDRASWGPVVDYHVQRTMLRTGAVSVKSADLMERLAERRLVTEDEEQAVRLASRDAMEILSGETGLDHAALDIIAFEARRRCPEETEPECPVCPLEPGCAKRKDLFQPVIRTTFY